MSHLDKFSALKEMIENANERDDVTFHEIIIAGEDFIFKSGIFNSDKFQNDNLNVRMADIFEISTPTFRRWKAKEATPHPAVRKHFYKRLLGYCSILDRYFNMKDFVNQNLSY